MWAGRESLLRTNSLNEQLTRMIMISHYRIDRILCVLRKNSNCRVNARRITRLPPIRSNSTTAESAIASPFLSYDRDTGIVWEASSSSSASPDAAQKSRISPLYQTIIGIEIHAQLSIPTKLFSSAPTRHNTSYFSNTSTANAANTLVHPYDLAFPGTLPSLSQSAVKASVISAAALNCQIHKQSRFERKHYFYPDLPNGYQITQQRWPLASDGVVEFLPWSNKQIPAKQAKDKTDKRRRGKSKHSNKLKSIEILDENIDESQKCNQPVQLRIERIQMEQDTGKTTTHILSNGNNCQNEQSYQTQSHIDLNRAGCALIEIVSRPDLRSAHEAAGVVEKIRKLLKHVGTCDGRMEEGSLRCDLNVSIAPVDGDYSHCNEMIRTELPKGNGQRVEVKNLNSLRQIIAATEYEALRQSVLLLNNAPTGRETRTFHVKPISDVHPLGGETFVIRMKGDAIDYRFLPEPDIPPLILDEDTLGSNMSLEDFIEHNMPESPEEAAARLVKDYGLSDDVANVITADPPAIILFEQAVETARKMLMTDESSNVETTVSSVQVLVGNWLCNDLFALVKKSATEGKDNKKIDFCNEEESSNSLNHPISVEFSTVDAKRLGALVAMVANGTLSTSMAKKILNIMFRDDLHSSPTEIAGSNGWRIISDMNTLIQLCESIVLDDRNSSQLEQYKQGGKFQWKIEKFFVGKIMAASQGNAHPERMKEALTSVLERVAPVTP